MKWTASAMIWNFWADEIFGGKLISKYAPGIWQISSTFVEQQPFGTQILPVLTPLAFSIEISISWHLVHEQGIEFKNTSTAFNLKVWPSTPFSSIYLITLSWQKRQPCLIVFPFCFPTRMSGSSGEMFSLKNRIEPTPQKRQIRLQLQKKHPFTRFTPWV